MKFILRSTFLASLVALTLTLIGAESAFAQTTVRKDVYFPAASLAYSSSSITRVGYGLSVPATGAGLVTLVLPQPSDAALNQSTEPVKVTLYFAVPSASVPNNYRWQLKAGGAIVDFNGSPTGWDSLDFSQTENGALVTYPAASGYLNLMKSQTWTAKWSSAFSTWYFGSSVTVSSALNDNDIWHFGFGRGNAAGNGETNTGSFTIVGAQVSYPASI
ncbi:hypothetical protein [Sorangium sp. So ce385]|uniref:hypothetical protein n=1 Tax=Sorangium sp. So ce385 TaxID=3133308 RepID=UPI003F5C66C5